MNAHAPLQHEALQVHHDLAVLIALDWARAGVTAFELGPEGRCIPLPSSVAQHPVLRSGCYPLRDDTVSLIADSLARGHEYFETAIDREGEDDVDTCRGCGCTDDHACPGGCAWVEPGLCSACAEQLELEQLEPALAPASLAIAGPWWSAPSEYAPNDDTPIAVELGPRSAR